VKILSRILAVAIVSIPFARLMLRDEASKMARYEGLSHEALLAVLREQHQPAGALMSYVIAFMLLGVAFLVVHGIGVGIERLAVHLGIARRF
jgi:hypothetical protein